MKINLLFVGLIGAVVVGYAIYARRPNRSITGGTVPALQDTPENAAITEAAYHQDPTTMAGAFGEDENSDGTEVTSLQ